ncbi:helix-turn-helix domain-containing protein [Vagococcus xieshaowenii]|nr:helix-turn-helix domain-containing protein [Vagococcus xieshaowenii]
MFLYFLQRNHQKKFKLFDYLYQHINSSGPLSTLSDLIDEDDQTLQRYINELNMQMSAINDGSHTLIKKHGPEYYELVTENKNCHKLYQAIKKDYIEQSNTYQLCLFICCNKKITLNRLIDELGMSRSTVYKTLSQFNELLAEFGLVLEKNEHDYYIFSGNERSIRIFQFNFFRSCLPIDSWPFSFKKEKIKHYIPSKSFIPTPSKQLKRDFLLFNTVIYLRISQGHFIKTTLESVPYFRLEDDTYVFFNFKFLDRYFRKNQTKYIEQLTYQLYVFYLFPELIPEKFVLKAGDSMTHCTKQEVVLLKQALHDVTRTLAIRLTDEQFYFMLFHLYVHFNISLIMEVTKLNQSELFSKLLTSWYLDEHQGVDPTLRTTQECVNNVFEGYFDSDTYRNINTVSITNYLSQIMLDLLQLVHEPVAHKHCLLVDFSSNYFKKRLFEKKIEQLYSGRITLTHNIDEATIIVTNNQLIEADTHRTKVLYLHNVNHEEQLNACIGQLSSLINTTVPSIREARIS